MRSEELLNHAMLRTPGISYPTVKQWILQEETAQRAKPPGAHRIPRLKLSGFCRAPMKRRAGRGRASGASAGEINWWADVEVLIADCWRR